jgi:hypothetical protein
MSSGAPFMHERDAIEALNRQIDELEIRRSRILKELIAWRANENAGKIWLVVKKVQREIRRPTRTFELWPVAVMLAGPTFFGGIALVMVHAGTGNLGLAAIWAALLTAIAAAILAFTLFVPETRKLDMQISGILEYQAEINSGIASRQNAIAEIDWLLIARRSERNSITKSIEYRGAQLLTRNWRAMRGIEWEMFLCEVFRIHGARVETTKTSGDQGVVLIVELGNRRCAVQAKGYDNAVSNSAVQEAVAGMAHYRCNGCAVITNSHFTKAAIDLARSNRCLLVGEEELTLLVLGKLAI